MDGLFEAYEESFSNQQKQIQALKKQLSEQNVLCEECTEKQPPWGLLFVCTECGAEYSEQEFDELEESKYGWLLCTSPQCTLLTNKGLIEWSAFKTKRAKT